MMDKCKTAKEKQELGTTIKQLQQSIDSLKVSICSIRLLTVLSPFDHCLLIQLSLTANIMPMTLSEPIVLARSKFEKCCP